jgi:hypothetical protein
MPRSANGNRSPAIVARRLPCGRDLPIEAGKVGFGSRAVGWEI